MKKCNIEYEVQNDSLGYGLNHSDGTYLECIVVDDVSVREFLQLSSFLSSFLLILDSAMVLEMYAIIVSF